VGTRKARLTCEEMKNEAPRIQSRKTQKGKRGTKEERLPDTDNRTIQYVGRLIPARGGTLREGELKGGKEHDPHVRRGRRKHGPAIGLMLTEKSMGPLLIGRSGIVKEKDRGKGQLGCLRRVAAH